MTPSLSLVYNSQSGDGSLGMCWNLSGLSAITRIPKTLFSTSGVKGIDYSMNDGYALDGNPLVMVLGSYGNSDSIYYTEIETYQKIQASGLLYEGSTAVGPEKFTVLTKDGRTIEYGATFDSRFVPQGSGYRAPYMWLINRVVDRNGNYILYEYDTTSATVRLGKITYGNYNGNFTTVLHFLPMKKYVGAQFSYVGGRPVINDFVYEHIGVENNGKVIYEYLLNYIFKDGKYFLNSVTKQIPASSFYVPSTSVVWGGNTSVPVPESAVVQLYYSVPRENCQFIPCDINGDGKDDLLCIYNYNQTNYLERLFNNSTAGRKAFGRNRQPTNLGVTVGFDNYNKFGNTAALIADVNGDGINEFISTYLMKIKGYNPTFKINIFTKDEMWGASLSLSHSKEAPVFVCGDFNNDGYDDLLLIEDETVYGKYTGQLIYFKKDYQIFSETLYFNLPEAPTQVYCADFNGNGLTDLFVLTDKSCYFYKNNGGSKNAAGETPVSFSQLPDYQGIHFNSNCKAVRMGDFNGDGLPDFLINGNENGRHEWRFAINNGKYGLFAPDYPSLDASVVMDENTKECIVTDYDHDGTSEIVLINRLGDGRTQMDWYKSSALGFVNVRSQTVSRGDYFFRGSACVGNFSGTGREEIFAYESCLWEEKAAGNSWITGCPDTECKEEKVISVIDGLGKKVEFAYQSLSQPVCADGRTFYTRNENRQSFSYANIQVPLICLKTSRVSDPWQIFSETDYSYSNLVYGVNKKSLYGFTETTAYRKLEGMRTIKTVTWDYETGLPLKTSEKIRTADNRPVNDIETVNNLTHYSTYRLLPSSGKNINYLTGTTVDNYYEDYDNWGNPSLVFSRCIGVEKKEIHKYITTNSWWCPDRISKTVSQRTSEGKTVERVKEYTYDDRGNILQEIQDPGDKNSLVTEYAGFNKFWQPQQTKVTGNGVTRTSSVVYTSSGRYPAQTTDELGETVTYRWDESKGCKESETSPRGTTRYRYDVWGRLTGTTSPEGINTAYEISLSTDNTPARSVYRTVSHTEGQSPYTVWYDVLGRELRNEVYGLNTKKIWTDTEYDTAGRVLRVTEPYFAGDASTLAESYTYDVYGRVATVATPSGETQYTYNRLVTTVVSPSQTQVTTTDYEGKTVEQVTNGKSVTYTYYPSGLVKEALPQDGRPVKMEYDLQGNRTRIADPDGGTIETTYDAFGQTVKEVQRVHAAMTSETFPSDSIGVLHPGTFPSVNSLFPPEKPLNPLLVGTVVTTYEYLPCGLVSKVGCGKNNTVYSYDDRKRVRNISKNNSSEPLENTSLTYEYDSFDRVKKITQTIGTEKTLVNSMEYDELGRLYKETYPSGYGLQRFYDSYGNVSGIGLLAEHVGKVIWDLLETNARGQILQEKKTNLITTYAYNACGQVTSINTPSVCNLSYLYNSKHLLSGRNNLTTLQIENFTYDDQNRLRKWAVFSRNGSVHIPMSYSVTYDPSSGNITEKSDIRYTLAYEKNNHAVTSISGKPADIPQAGQKITYTDYKKVKTIVQGDASLRVTYGVDEQRWKEILKTPKKEQTTYFAENYEEVIEGGISHKIHYLRQNGRLIGIVIKKDNLYAQTKIVGGDPQPPRPNPFTYYAFTDHQGSLIALTAQDGTIERRYAYDPWGKRRNPYNWNLKDTLNNLIVSRGYTQHEHLDDFDLINMNGRLYDPLLGMFLSPDPYIQAPDNWLNYNRYTYCLNNPLMYTDPSGEIFGIDDLIFGAIFAGVANVINQIGSGNVNSLGSFFQAFHRGTIGGIAGAAAGGILNSSGFISGAINGFAGGFTGGLITGSLNAWSNGAGLGQSLKSGLATGGMAGLTSGLLGGLMSGSTAVENGGNYWSGKGTTFVQESTVADGILGGEYFRDDVSMQGYVRSKNGWEKGKFGISDITVEGTPPERDKYFYDRDKRGIISRILQNKPGIPVEVGGVTNRTQISMFRYTSNIYLSSHNSLADFTLTLNHEFIHAYHNYLGYPTLLRDNYHNATEYSAYSYSFQYAPSLALRLNSLTGMKINPSLYRLPWPKFLIPIN